jgi:hypothetical protein
METSHHNCQLEKIAAYLDDQLEPSACSQFEAHIEVCSMCRGELNSQRQFLCELDSVLANSRELPMPDNFARIVSARAESDMRGLRERPERRRALLFSLILAVVAFALLGVTAGKSFFINGRVLANKVWVVLSLLGTALHDAFIGLSIILRVLSRMFLLDSPVGNLLAALLLLLAIASLSHLIVSYHRRNQIRLFE